MAKVYKAKINDRGAVITGKVRLSYPHLFEKDEKYDRYSASFILEPDTPDMAVYQMALEKAKEEGRTKLWGGKIPTKNFRIPIEEDEDGNTIIKATSKYKVKCLDMDGDEVLDPEELYGGCYVRAGITFSGYSNEGKGISAYLEVVRKVADGERFGSGARVSDDDFLDEDEEDDDLLG